MNSHDHRPEPVHQNSHQPAVDCGFGMLVGLARIELMTRQLETAVSTRLVHPFTTFVWTASAGMNSSYPGRNPTILLLRLR